jgi:hypothetical protein
MSKASRLGIYADVREVADLALAHNGGSYDLPDRAAAINFSHRFYRFRRLYGEIYHSDGSPNPYDKLIIPRPVDQTLHFRIRENIGTFRPAKQRSIPTALAPDEDLFNIAQQLVAKIKGE